ncbi:MAG: hypothetical protein V3V01_02260 [Acidimicrobiales bacterium]
MVNLLGVVAVIVVVFLLMALTALLVRRRGRTAELATTEAIDPTDPTMVRGDVATVATPAVVKSQPTHVAAAAVSESQCPRCGRFDLAKSDSGWRCNWCQHRWYIAADEPWPDVALRIWLPKTAANAEFHRLQGDDQHGLST